MDVVTIYLMWQVRHSVLPRPVLSLPLMRARMPLVGEAPSCRCTSWHEEHSILSLINRASLMVLPVSDVPDQEDGTGATFTVKLGFGSPIL